MDRRQFLQSSAAAAGLLAWGTETVSAQQAALRFSTPEADPQQIKTWEAIFADFKTAKGIETKGEYGLWDDLVKKISSDLVAGTPPDIIAGGSKPGFVQDLAKRGLTVDLRELVDEIGRSDFDPAALAQWQYKGQQVAIPYGRQTCVLWCRTDLFAEAGISKLPVTWDDYMAAAEKLHKPEKGIYGAVFPAGRTWNTHIQFIGHMWSAGGFFFNEKLEVVLDSPETVRAAKYYTEMVKRFSPPDATTYGFREAAAAYTTGKAATTFYFGRVLTHLYQQNPALLKVSETVHIPRDKQNRVWDGQDEFVVMKTPKSSRSIDLVRFIMSDPNQLYRVFGPVISHVVPTRKSVVPKLQEHEWVRDNPKIVNTLIQPHDYAVSDVLESSKHPFNYKMDAMISKNVLPDMIQRIVVGGDSVEKAVSAAHKTAVEIAKDIKS
ncbi:ABC transporter substrate-binding protein [Tardiphaga robiniae]|uniref:ABC transporter substrate-binding protein n=1 Tax=Tardiphaga robiniae TaxID=943830 RepID=UPI001585E280|nr:extracellular solute-binding protein [Tardiphaga robiniae]NUU42607.1 extracellular solute-binding protein [Tardiphaga robiniae]